MSESTDEQARSLADIAVDKPGLHLMFGGTFDPVHNGHLRMAVELREAAARESGLALIHLLPSRRPAHREQPGATPEERLRMLADATAGEPGLTVDRRELDRAGPSYSVDTLAELREELGPGVPLAMAIGTDSFATLDRWNRWQEITRLAHIIVIERPGYTIGTETEAGRLLKQNRAEHFSELIAAPSGRVLPVSLSLLDISATDIRARLAGGRSVRYLVPDTVWRYISDRALYSSVPSG